MKTLKIKFSVFWRTVKIKLIRSIKDSTLLIYTIKAKFV